MITRDPADGDCADIIAINQLAHAYAQAISRGSPHDAAQVYSADGALTTPQIGPITGRPAIEEAIREGTKDLEMIFHVVQNAVVDVHGDRANACFQISEWSKRRSDGAVFLYLGFYDDELVRLPEGWRFATRRLVSLTMGRADVDFKKLHPITTLRPSLA